MTNFLNWPQRRGLISRLLLRQRLAERAARKSPAVFRRELFLAPHFASPFRSLIQPWQAADFAALDPAWLALAGLGEIPKFQRAWIERPRGHSKTSDMAMQLAWILLYAPESVQGLAAAADKDQAGLITEALQQLAVCNPRWCGPLKFQKHLVLNPATRSRLEVISSDVQSSWGALPDFVICDELCHWAQPDLWYSLLSSAAKKPLCTLAVLTNAGVGRGWQWELREAARRSPDWYFSTLDGPQAPWISAKFLEEQRLLLPQPVFDRLWLNRWQHSDGGFVTLAEAEACRRDDLSEQQQAHPHRHYVAALDYAEKHDYTVGVIIHREGELLIVDRMDVVRPRPGQPVKVAWVDRWISETASRFQPLTLVLDEYQLLGTIQKYESLLPLRRFEFQAGKGNHALALHLRNLILHQQVRWYPGCGQLPDAATRDDLETELASLLLQQSPTGRCRIAHRNDGLHHDDRAFALGAACLHAAQQGGGEWMHVLDPASSGEFRW